MNRNESRYFQTAVKMDEALIALLEKKDFAYITIKEICETAGVNRSTFYLHYENTADLLSETTQYILDKHFSYYSTNMQILQDRLEACDKQDLVFVTSEYLTPYLRFVQENQRIFQVSVRQFHSMRMDEVYGKMFEHIFDPILSRFQIPTNQRHYVMKFYLTGIFAIVMEWLDRGCADTMESVIRVIVDCVLGDRQIYG